MTTSRWLVKSLKLCQRCGSENPLATKVLFNLVQMEIYQRNLNIFRVSSNRI